MASLFSRISGPKNALIQGASRGIGLELARHLVEQRGFETVIGTSRFPEKSDGLRAREDQHLDHVHKVPLDVTDEESGRPAQNQLTRTLSIELGRRHKTIICVALRPGTVEW